MGTLISVLTLPWARKRLLVETVVLLALARMAILILPFSWVCKVFGRSGANTSKFTRGTHARRIRAVRAALRKVPKYVPWTSKCLDQALTGKVMLGLRGIPTTVYFGVATDDKGDVNAHAWLRSGNVYISGG